MLWSFLVMYVGLKIFKVMFLAWLGTNSDTH